ncbi:MAG: 4Fe-4S dicluster domain-containing protein [Bacteroidetes bacterium]|nr:4Fe-4S dicluster domain-containing protein [Bacteroidota bacterium]
MNKFGFTTAKSRVIEYDSMHNKLLDYIIQNEPSFSACLSCGSCTATCSAANLTNFNIRRLNIQIRHGELEGIRQEIDKCMLCGKCLLVCPRGINTRNAIMIIKKGLVSLGIND